jgi:hypothetical protein
LSTSERAPLSVHTLRAVTRANFTHYGVCGPSPGGQNTLQNTKYATPGSAGASAPELPMVAYLVFCNVFWTSRAPRRSPREGPAHGVVCKNRSRSGGDLWVHRQSKVSARSAQSMLLGASFVLEVHTSSAKGLSSPHPRPLTIKSVIQESWLATPAGRARGGAGSVTSILKCSLAE